MQPLKQLSETLRALADRDHCIFSTSDLAAAVPKCGQLPVLLSRATKSGLLLKFYDHQRTPAEFSSLLQQRVASLSSSQQIRKDFLNEMSCFLPVATVRDTLESPDWWTYQTYVFEEQAKLALSSL